MKKRVAEKFGTKGLKTKAVKSKALAGVFALV